MDNLTPADGGWFLDEYDGPKFWQHVDFHGGRPYLEDPLSSLDADAGECWAWQGWAGGPAKGRYGRFRLAGIGTPAHRIAYREFGNKLPDDYDVDHLCRNTLCVNPAHLEAVTHQENMARGARAQATHCKNGHEYSPDNLMYRTPNVRECRVCVSESKRRTYLRSKSA